ncbi:MAG: hypothetical protein ABW208_26795 [Pyrinomonadaceae bacterium]
MQIARPAPPPAPKRPKLILFACVLAALFVSHGAAAQSGRRTVKKVSPAPAEPANGTQSDKPAPRITSVIIGGHDISKEIKEQYSTNVSTVVKAFTSQLNGRPGLLMGVVNGGKMTREQAVERAKREQGAYVLWFGYNMRMAGLFDNTVEHIDYVVLMPQTAETLTDGRVYPDEQKTHADPRAIMRLPTNRRRARPDPKMQLETGGREIADRVRNKL